MQGPEPSQNRTVSTLCHQVRNLRICAISLNRARTNLGTRRESICVAYIDGRSSEIPGEAPASYKIYKQHEPTVLNEVRRRVTATPEHEENHNLLHGAPAFRPQLVGLQMHNA